ncbi:MAG: hypothetical protein RBT62_11260 [Spirochaetia bacterium]|nr:hypothetical protein [Spirochaetia bacterium]
MPRLNERIVIATPRPRVASCYHEAVEEDGQGNAPHRVPIVRVYDLRAYA